MKQLSDGIWIPDSGQTCYDWTMVEIELPDHLMNIWSQFSRPIENIIHAGGNIGIYTLKYAKRAQNVYVFEPASENFEAMSMNCGKESNVFMFRSALGDNNTPIDIVNEAYDKQCGAWRVEGNGIIPKLRIDDMNLPNISIIQLDVEGYEFFILKGAVETIKKHKPLICVEMFNHGIKYGHQDQKIKNFLNDLGYTRSMVCGNDTAFAHSSMFAEKL